MTSLEKKLLIFNILTYLAVALFSYSYVDLNLTLSTNKLSLSFVKTMQDLGYYHRLFATLVYVFLISTAFVLFVINLVLIKNAKATKNYLFKSVAINSIILIFAYPFLSSDIFNYIFDAKIITHYHLSPYTHRALDFPDDTWIRFMRWTHRYSPYGPLWIGYSLIPTVLGLGKFTITLFMFKIFIGFFHFVNTYIIYKILNKIKPSLTLFGTAAYALNPLLLLEGVANAHNDVVLATLLLLSVYFLIRGKTFFSIMSVVVGISIKYIPILILPWTTLRLLRSKNISLQQLIVLNLITMAVFTYLFSSVSISVPFVSSGATQIQFQPWYLFWTIPLAVLIPEAKLFVLTTALSLGSALRYLPYLYYGDWSHKGTILFMETVIILPLVLFSFYYIVIFLKKD